tara:strand:+ start:20775 stop:21677 length:903 start_codon:yes stop_codon:yes gene_type:complete
MDRVKLNDNLDVSRIVYGMWRLGDDADTSPAHVQAKIEACLEQGITTMDQADIYGGYEAEALLGACFAQAPALRDKLEIITKCDIVAPAGRYSDARVKYYDTSAAHIEASINHSLALMKIEHIDLLLIHRPDPFMDHHETGAALDRAVASGKVGAIGVSNFKPHDWSLLQSATKTPLVTNQIEISVMAHEAFSNGDLAFHQQMGVSSMAWSPLSGGALFEQGNPHTQAIRDGIGRIAAQRGIGVDSLAIAWLLAHPAGIIPVMGTNSLDRIKRFHEATSTTLDRQTWFEIYTLALGREVA